MTPITKIIHDLDIGIRKGTLRNEERHNFLQT